MVKEIPLTQGKVALVDDEDYEKIEKYKWNANYICGLWYARTNGLENRKRITLRLHRVILNPKPDEDVDHINGNGLDNRRCNLRIATPSQNQGNRLKNIRGSSIYKGVSWYKKTKKWVSQIRYNNKRYRIGYFELELDAAKAYDKKAKECFGEYARLNFSNDDEE